ncbi:putative uncharacterized protein DDB_G0286901 [Condylostylus longicornis]|uniref:putative uncharacterized protein DDB_G0286901 n=1 Tax=Condylostylus longicornis TaxID=2530218 RepID=UPI00244DA563|nr:putative uncharacterized protein DDB_G0286901 [Condylostylus longicornis]
MNFSTFIKNSSTTQNNGNNNLSNSNNNLTNNDAVLTTNSILSSTTPSYIPSWLGQSNTNLNNDNTFNINSQFQYTNTNGVTMNHYNNNCNGNIYNRNRYAPYQNRSYSTGSINFTNNNNNQLLQQPLLNQSFSSITAPHNNCTKSNNPNQPITLQINNLDYSLEEQHLRGFLVNQLKPITPVISLIFEGSSCAKVTVPDLYYAKLVVSTLHRKKIGYKRVVVSYTRDSSTTEISTLRCQVAGLLKVII